MPCKHEQAQMIGYIERAELKDGHHTAFYLMKCLGCGDYTGFPLDNFREAIAAGWQIPDLETQRILRKPNPKEWSELV